MLDFQQSHCHALPVAMEELCCVAEEAQCAHPTDTKVYRAYMLSVQYEYQLSLTDPRDKIVL